MYKWDGMDKISRDEALKLFNDKCIYKLYEDDTEAIAESMEDLLGHCGEFGIEKDEIK